MQQLTKPNSMQVISARIHMVSSWVFAPYLLRVSFAGYLN